MSFLKRLFGLGSNATGEGGAPATPKALANESYKGFTLTAAPMAEGGQFRLAGSVSKAADGPAREHRFVRADLFPSADEAAQAALRKGRQLVDEQGDRLFEA